jgi:citrate synthase
MAGTDSEPTDVRGAFEPPAALTAQQAAARLGVKVETLYAYVSRGLLERLPGPDRRSSRFDGREIERLARRGRRGSSPGSLSLLIGSGLTLIEQERLSFRGLDATVLARHAPFEAVAEWLWLAEQPPADAAPPHGWQPWTAGDDALAAARSTQPLLPDGTAAADRLRTIAALTAPLDPLRFDLSPAAVAAAGRRLIATMVDGLPARCADAPVALRLADDAPPIPDTIAARLWPKLTEGTATPAAVAALNGALVLVSDHGLAASTLAARIAASVRADPYTVVSSGLGTLSGPLHGAASTSVHQLFARVARPERAVAVVGDFLRREKVIPGFGHLIYKGWDPRARALLELLRTAAIDDARFEVVERVLALLEGRVPVFPNVDFALAALTWCAAMDEGAGEAIFGIARSSGWLAHALEEYGEQPLRFRPRAQYVGPAPSSAPC